MIKKIKRRVCKAFLLGFRAEECLSCFKSDLLTTELFGNCFAVDKVIFWITYLRLRRQFLIAFFNNFTSGNLSVSSKFKVLIFFKETNKIFY